MKNNVKYSDEYNGRLNIFGTHDGKLDRYNEMANAKTNIKGTIIASIMTV